MRYVLQFTGGVRSSRFARPLLIARLNVARLALRALRGNSILLAANGADSIALAPPRPAPPPSKIQSFTLRKEGATQRFSNNSSAEEGVSAPRLCPSNAESKGGLDRRGRPKPSTQDPRHSRAGLRHERGLRVRGGDARAATAKRRAAGARRWRCQGGEGARRMQDLRQGQGRQGRTE